MAIQFLPFHPLILAIAQELQRRAIENPEINPLTAIKNMLDERPALDLHSAEVLSSQINDLMVLANPPADRVRLSLMLFLPHRRGSLFTASEMMLRDALFFPEAPCHRMAGPLATNIDSQWDEVLQVLKNLPLPPMALVNSDGVPVEARHPAASGPMPSNIQQFMNP